MGKIASLAAIAIDRWPSWLRSPSVGAMAFDQLFQYNLIVK